MNAYATDVSRTRTSDSVRACALPRTASLATSPSLSVLSRTARSHRRGVGLGAHSALRGSPHQPALHRSAGRRECQPPRRSRQRVGRTPDRKSTRLNSSHQIISYAVFCLKKKKKKKKHKTKKI